MHLTPSQLKAVEFQGSCGIVAAPGSGKTMVLVEKVARLVQGGTPLSRILLVTFTEKAGQELKARLSRRLDLPPEPVSGAPIRTRHSRFAGLLREQGAWIGVDPEFTVLEEPLANLMRHETVRGELLSLLRNRDPEAVRFVTDFDFYRSVGLAVRLLRHPAASNRFATMIEALRRAYVAQKQRLRSLDFQDLEEGGLSLLREAEVVNRIEFDWIFIDEFQDTDSPQWEMAKLLYRPPHTGLVVVGDPRQSIYRFRGAHPERFWECLRWIETGGGALFYLDENFRSDPGILDFVNRLSPKLFPSFSRPLVATRPPAPQGGVETLPFTAPSDAEGRREAEARRVARSLLDLVSHGTAWHQIALLFRTRLAMPVYQQLFRDQKIPIADSAGDLLLEKPEVLVLLWALRHYLNPEDPLPPLALQGTPLEDLPPSSILKSFPEGIEPLLDTLAGRFGESGNLRELKEWIGKLMQCGCKSLQGLLEALETLRREGAPIHPSRPEDQPGVRFLTVHAAKGLEFPFLFLCDLGATPSRRRPPFLLTPDGRLLFKVKEATKGLRKKLEKSEEYEQLEAGELEAERAESLRLLYVGMTRARERLFLPLPVSDRRPPKDSWAALLTPGQK